MKYFIWDPEKNMLLKGEREVGFEDVIIAVMEGRLLDIVEHANKQKYPNQQILIIEINHYAYLVPFIESEKTIFLKTIIPSRKATRDYIIKKSSKL